MDFQLSEKRLAIQHAVREFAEKELLPGVIERDEKSEYPLELYKKLGKMGYVGLPYEEKYGGSGGDYLDYAIAVEEISKVDASLGISYSVAMSLYGGSILCGRRGHVRQLAGSGIGRTMEYRAVRGRNGDIGTHQYSPVQDTCQDIFYLFTKTCHNEIV